MSNMLELTIYKIKIGDKTIHTTPDEFIALGLWSAFVTSSLFHGHHKSHYLRLKDYVFKATLTHIRVYTNEMVSITHPITHDDWNKEYDFTQFGLPIPGSHEVGDDLECSLKLLTLPVQTPYGIISKEDVVGFFCNNPEPSQLIYTDVVLTSGLYFVESAGVHIEMTVPCRVEYDKNYLSRGFYQALVTNPIA